MAVCDPQTLLSENPCYANLNTWNKKVIKVQMLCNLKEVLGGSGEITCDIQTLLTQGACFYEMSEDFLNTVELQLLCDISALVAGG